MSERHPLEARLDAALDAVADENRRAEYERCGVCGHTLMEHHRDGWTCDCEVCPWQARSWKARALAAEAQRDDVLVRGNA